MAYGPWTGGQSPWYVNIQPYMKSLQILYCPSGPATTEHWANPNPSNGITWSGTSYLANHQLMGDGWWTSFNIATVPQPSRVIQYCDGGMNGQAGAPYYNTAVPNAWNLAGAWLMNDQPNCTGSCNDSNWEAPSNRHNGMCNVGYVDGHVKTQMTESWWYQGSVNYV